MDETVEGGRTARRSLIIFRAVFVGALLLGASHAHATILSVSAEIWVDGAEELSPGGQFVLYGKAVAKSDAGSVAVTARLRDPSGGSLTANTVVGTSTATANVSYTLDADTLASGYYQTLAMAEDAWGAQGCATELALVHRFEGRYYYLGDGGQGHEYAADSCAHICQRDIVYRPSNQGPYLWDRGVEIVFVFWGYCKHGYQGSFQRGLCSPPH